MGAKALLTFTNGRGLWIINNYRTTCNPINWRETQNDNPTRKATHPPTHPQK